MPGSYPTQLLIDGELRPGRGATFEVEDPARQETIGEVASASPEQLEAAVGAAGRAFTSWRGSSGEARRRALLAVAAALEEQRHLLAEVVTRETGRPHSRNLLYVEWIADVFRLYADLGRVHGGRVAPSNEPGQLSLVKRVPFGVVAAIVPWNYPLLLSAFKIAPAVAAGNTVVVKPSRLTTFTTLVLAEIFAEAMPPGVVNVLAGGGELGEALVRHPGTHMLAFTGSTAVGRRLGAICAEADKEAHLELGGKDPAVVFEDADPAVAAEGVAWASFLNAGQVCTATERVYVHRSLYDPFVERAVEVAACLRLGDPFDPSTEVGPMRTAGGRRKVLDHLEEATDKGAEVLVGGDAPQGPGYYLRPAVVTGVDHSMRLMREETFGPVLPVMAFEDDDEAFRLAADTEYGLGASFYTLDPRRVERAYTELPVGNVWVNDPVVDNLAGPLGGMRASGNARELGLEGLESFTATRHVHWNLDLRRKPWWYGTEREESAT